MPDYPPLQTEYVISDPDTLKVIADSRRLQILRLLHTAKTVKEVAEELALPSTKLYYHVNQLAEHGLIEVVETNVVSGIIEKVYRVTARRFRVDETLLSGRGAVDDHLNNMVNAILDDVGQEIRQSFRAGLVELARDKTKRAGDTLWRAHVHLTDAQFAEFYDRFQALLEEVGAVSEENDGAELEEEIQTYGMLLAFYPALRPPAGAGAETNVTEDDDGD